MLAEAKFVASACRYANAVPWRPHNNDVSAAFVKSNKAAAELGAVWYRGRRCLKPAIDGLALLRDEISNTQPRVIIAVGATALWALTEKEGIENWRGSELFQTLAPELQIPVVPTYHPASVLRAWDQRHLAVHDLRRANKVLNYGPTKVPDWRFILRPDFNSANAFLDVCEASPAELSVDIETKAGRIVCVGIAVDRISAICIPFIRSTGAPYWSAEEEAAIIMRLRSLLSSHKVVGHNFAYDAQYFSREMLVVPSLAFDTMLAQHVLFPGTPKSLAHCSSLYCEHHLFWKDDGKEWDPALHPEERLWAYNCTDCVKTFEVMEGQKALLEKYKLTEQNQFLIDLWPHVLLMMLRGVKVDHAVKEASKIELTTAINARRRWLTTAIGYDLNPGSAPQMKSFFYEEMGVKPIKHHKTKQVTLDKKALTKIGEQHILLYPITQTIEDIRSLGVFKNTFASAPLDIDGRMRCSFNIGGTETFRFSSSENAFGSGTNLQNIPSGNRSTTLAMPNMRKLFIPDTGMEVAEIDLAGADAQVVAWEANDERLKAAFRAGIKIHTVNAKDLFGSDAGPDGKREPYYTMAKQGVHLTNYLGQPGTLAKTLSITTHQAEKFQKRWFDIHPGIKDWHRRVEAQIQTTRMVTNRFGFRRYYFGRMDDILSEAVAWVPQSTVALVINKALIIIAKMKAPVSILLQVHDSLVFEYPVAEAEPVLGAIHQRALVPVPYPDPLTIQFGLKTSPRSWGHCEDRKWPSFSHEA